MTERIPQSTAKTVLFKAYLASDHVTEATGKTIVITISKNGAAFGNPNAGATNATEISSGWYKVALDTTDTGSVGPLAVRGAVALVDDVGVLLEVVKATNAGFTGIPDAASAASGGLPTIGVTIPNATAGAAGGLFIAGTNAATTITTSLTTTFTGNLTGSVGSVTGLTASNLDATISSRAATGDAMTLTSGERNSVADALLDRSAAIETGVTPRGLFRLLGAVIAGKVSGAGTTTNTFRNTVADSKDRVTATVDSSGNRSAITTDMT